MTRANYIECVISLFFFFFLVENSIYLDLKDVYKFPVRHGRMFYLRVGQIAFYLFSLEYKTRGEEKKIFHNLGKKKFTSLVINV